MTSEKLAEYHNALQVMAEQMAQYTPTVEAMRSGTDLFGSFTAEPEGVVFEPAEGCPCPAEWATPEGVDGDATLIWMHGGAFVAGSLESHRKMVAHLAKAAGVRGLTVDYRLAPEYPFPLPIEDGMAVYRWLLDSGVDRRSLAVGGDSAGGCIAAGLLVAIRDAGVAQPAAAVLFSPLLDLEARSETMDSNDASDFMNGRDVVLGAAESYLAGQDPSDPQASPVNADLEGLPPMLLQVGRDEVLLGEVESFAKQAAEAGVEVELQVMDGVQHLFQLTAGAEEADAAISTAGAFVAAHLKISDPDS